MAVPKWICCYYVLHLYVGEIKLMKKLYFPVITVAEFSHVTGCTETIFSSRHCRDLIVPSVALQVEIQATVGHRTLSDPRELHDSTFVLLWVEKWLINAAKKSLPAKSSSSSFIYKLLASPIFS